VTDRAAIETLTPLEPPSPFKFLDYYGEDDKNLFAGRDREIRDVVAGILRARTLVLYSRSGLGKTSLLLAGVFPELVARGLRPVYVRTFDQPLADLRTALGAAEGADLREAVRTAGTGTVLVCDQFEELFIRFRDQPGVRTEFIRTVADLANDRALDVRLVFSLREEYLAELDDFRALLPDLFSNEYRLHPLTAFGARQTISRALQQHGIGYEQRMLTGLVDTLEGSRYDPAILQILCYELYKETVARETSPVILKASDLERLGGLEGIFRRHVKSLTRALGDRRLLALVILDNMVTREQTKRAVTVDALLDSYFIAAPDEVIEVLGLLETHNLIRRVERGEETFFELIHDRLVSSVQEWITSDPQFFNLHHAAEVVATAARGEAFRKQPELLLTAGQVRTVVGDYRERLRFNDIELELLLRSAAYRRIPDVVSYWAGRFGHARSPEIVLGLLGDPDPEVRRGGAEAACRVRDEDGRLAERCLELALGDANEEVRRAAGTSLAYLRGSVQERSLVNQLRSRRTRIRALEVLADFFLVGPLSKSFPWIWRMRAQRIVADWRIRQNRDTIHRRASKGALGGFCAGLAYVLCAIISPLWWLFLSFGEGVQPNQAGELLTVCLGGALAIGTLFGWRAAVSNTKTSAISGEERWSRCFRIWVAAFPLLSGAFLAVYSARSLFRSIDQWGALLLSAFAIALLASIQVLVGAEINLAQACIGASPSAGRVWLWAAILTLGFPSLIPMLLNVLGVYILREAQGSAFDIFLLVWLAFSLLWSLAFLSESSALGLGARELSVGIVASPRYSPRVARAVAVVAVISTFLAAALLYGRHTVPGLGTWHDLSDHQEHNVVQPRSLVAPKSSYHFLRCSRGTPEVLALSAPIEQADGDVVFSGVKVEGEVNFLIPPGYHLLRMTARKPQKIDATLACPQVLKGDQLAQLETGSTGFIRIVLEPGRRETWRHKMSARWPQYAGKSIFVDDAFLVLRNGMTARANVRFDSGQPHFVSFSSDAINLAEAIGEAIPIDSQGGLGTEIILSDLKIKPPKEADARAQLALSDTQVELILSLRFIRGDQGGRGD